MGSFFSKIPYFLLKIFNNHEKTCFFFGPIPCWTMAVVLALALALAHPHQDLEEEVLLRPFFNKNHDYLIFLIKNTEFLRRGTPFLLKMSFFHGKIHDFLIGTVCSGTPNIGLIRNF